MRTITTASASKAHPFRNSLGMKFVPVTGTEVLFSIWETRRQDYEEYAKAKAGVDDEWKTEEYKGVPVGREADHPVVSVNWEDAQGFCKWLTEKERREGRLSAEQSYRLPSDWEWSLAVGLEEVRGGSPKDKDGGISDIYPWGKGYPPPKGAGNYNDESLKRKLPTVFLAEYSIAGYEDGYETTSPVGRFRANRAGIYDMGGNVWEWCEDWYDPSAKESRVLRGASWYNFGAGLLLSFRGFGTPSRRNFYIGFRVVMAGVSSR